jgi:hypothetical protein
MIEVITYTELKRNIPLPTEEDKLGNAKPCLK